MNDLVNNESDDFLNFKVIGIGKSQYESSNNNFTDGTDLPLVIDDSPNNQIWSNWGANQRDLFFLDKNGEFFCRISLTSTFNGQDILEKIYHLNQSTTAYLETEISIISNNDYIPGSTHGLSVKVINNSNFDAHYTGYHLSSNSEDIAFSNTDDWAYVIPEGDFFQIDYLSFTISDNPETQNVTIFAEPSIIDPCSDECSECDTECIRCPQGGESQISFLIDEGAEQGDANLDGLVNVLDVVLIVNYVLSSQYYSTADINTDGLVNILDIVELVNLILD